MDGSYDPMNLFMAQNMGLQPQTPMPQSQPMAGPQNVQMPSEINHLNDVINQYIGNKQNQTSNPNLTQTILAGRFKPTLADSSRSVFENAISSPSSYISPEQVAQQRATMELAPYSAGLDLATKQAQLQNLQATAQYAPEMEQAKIQALRAQSGIFNSPNGGVAAGQPQLSGDQFLQTLNPQQAAQVKALAEGRMQFPAGFALKSPYWQQMISAVSQYDPNFDAVNFNSRAKTRSSFTSGADANNITALNTALAHLGTLSQNYDKLGNTSIPAINTATNYLGNALGFSGIQTNTANVGADSEAVAHELAKVFRSTGMSEGEINAWKDKISTSASPAQSKAVIGSALDLIDGRLSALGEKYNQGMGTSKQPLELLSPDAQKAYNTLRGFNTQQQQPNKVINFSDLPP